MDKVDIKLVAGIAEIIASIAVVVSLLFVVYSIDQNTEALQATNDNFIYELQSQRLRDVSSDNEFASIIVKFRTGENLTQAETLRYRLWMVGELNMWEMAYIRRKNGLLPEAQWRAWNGGWTVTMPNNFPEEWWLEDRFQYNNEFVEHVDAIYAEK